jgi:hypothetical protein
VSTIRCIYLAGAPTFPATDQHPDAVRYTVSPYVVDAIGGAPTLAEVQAKLFPTQDERAQAAVDAKDRLLFEINYDQEIRLRVLEGKAAITRAQYRDALIAEWKRQNP